MRPSSSAPSSTRSGRPAARSARRSRRPARPWSRWSPIDRAATRSTSRSSSATSRRTALTRATRPRVRALELPESLHSLVLSRIDTVGEEPRRTLKVASVVGRVFEAPVLPGAYPELGDLDDGHRAARHPARGRPRQPRSRGRSGLPLQARRDPGGRLREPAVRRAGDAPRPGRQLHRDAPTRTRSSDSWTSWRTTSGTATTRSGSACTWPAPPTPLVPRTPTPPPSTT